MDGSKRDLYDVLGVTKDATEQDIKKAFRGLAKELHPDLAKGDPAREARFKEVAAAYETLSDPERRSAYDRARARRAGGPRVWSGFHTPPRPGPAPQPPPPGDLDLEDLFTDFQAGDFGFGRRKERGGEPRPGRDIALGVDIPVATAEYGGTVEVTYFRLKRVDGSALVRAEEAYDLRVAPGTRHGESLRVDKMGDAGENGGPYGDLVVDVRVVRPPPGPTQDNDDGARGPRMRMRPDGPAELHVMMEVTVAEAILGGRVPVDTPTGTVKVAIPAGTSSGAKFRLRGRGGGAGTPKDVVAEVRILVPSSLDEESRRLIERFAELNPSVGR